MQVKVCGITNLQDALKAIECGAWALGFNFFVGSPRYIAPEQAAAIIDKLPPEIIKVGIFVNETLENINHIQQQVSIQMIQLHGNETPDFCKAITLPVIKAMRPAAIQDIDMLDHYTNLFAVLVDANIPNQFGGTGKSADWFLAKCMASKHRTILAGGLHADNVLSAISMVEPFALDLCSGVEAMPGIKSHEKLFQLFQIVSSRG